MKTEPVQPISFDEPSHIVSDNLLKFLEEIGKYKQQYINTDTLKNKNPIQLKSIESKFRGDANLIRKFLITKQIPKNILSELEQLLINLLPIIQSIGGTNASITKYWIKVLLEDFPFTVDMKHILRLHENSTRRIDIQDGDSVSDTEEEWET